MKLTAEGDMLKEEDVIIPDHIHTINDYAFSSSRSLRSVFIPDTVQEIGRNAFYNCTSLRKVRLPKALSYIGRSLFARCVSLEEVIMPESMTSLPAGMFFQCESMTSITLPADLESIERGSFENCVMLEGISMPKGVRVIGEKAFSGCTFLAKVNLNEGLLEIGEDAFLGCRSLKDLRLPASLKKAGKGAFETCGSLCLTAGENFYVHPSMLEEGWNMHWNLAATGGFYGKSKPHYQLHDSFLPNISLPEWKPEARKILAVNYLETYRYDIPVYEEWIRENRRELTEYMIREKRYKALHTAVEKGKADPEDIRPLFDLVQDPTERAYLMNHMAERTGDDLLAMLEDDYG